MEDVRGTGRKIEIHLAPPPLAAADFVEIGMILHYTQVANRGQEFKTPETGQTAAKFIKKYCESMAECLKIYLDNPKGWSYNPLIEKALTETALHGV
jgi:hypothetical protein